MKNIANTILLILGLSGLMSLSACDGKNEQNLPSGPAPVLTMKQLNLYQATCANCHENTESDAPQRLDATAWDERWSKGFASLLNTTINGFEGMPALGGCSACSQQDLELYIEYLASRSMVRKGGYLNE